MMAELVDRGPILLVSRDALATSIAEMNKIILEETSHVNVCEQRRSIRWIGRSTNLVNTSSLAAPSMEMAVTQWSYDITVQTDEEPLFTEDEAVNFVLKTGNAKHHSWQKVE